MRKTNKTEINKGGKASTALSEKPRHEEKSYTAGYTEDGIPIDFHNKDELEILGFSYGFTGARFAPL